MLPAIVRLRVRALIALSLLLVSTVRPAGAQPTFESTGERALGMGGAFVAVADDATATHWNPAGLATAGPAGMTVGWYRQQSGDRDAAAHAGAGRRGGTYTSLGTWPIGVSYGTFNMTGLVERAEGGQLDVQALRTSHFGVTLLQTVVEGLVVGSTLRYVRGDVVGLALGEDTVGQALDRTDDLEGPRSGAFDLDLALMADLQRVRVGLTWKNLRSPTFGDVADAAITIPRQTRFGLAVLPVDGLTLALDVDLETVDLMGDRRRMFALGGEGQFSPRFAVRSGVRWSLEGARRLVAAAGMSVGIRPGLWLDGHYTQSHAHEGREFGVALRAGL
jgi:hypothetical protein